MRGEKLTDELKVPLRLLPVRHMRALRKTHPLHLRDPVEERSDSDILRHVVTSVDDERGLRYFVKLGGNVPGLERASDDELVWPVPARALVMN